MAHPSIQGLKRFFGLAFQKSEDQDTDGKKQTQILNVKQKDDR